MGRGLRFEGPLKNRIRFAVVELSAMD